MCKSKGNGRHRGERKRAKPVLEGSGQQAKAKSQAKAEGKVTGRGKSRGRGQGICRDSGRGQRADRQTG